MASNPSQFPQAVVGGSPSFTNVTVTGTLTSSAGGSFISGPLGVAVPQLQATTGVAATALINGTATIISWTAPNDGNMHRAQIYLGLQVTVAETGGAVTVTSPLPGGAGTLTDTPFAGGAGISISEGWVFRLVAPGGVVSVNQSSALTAGTAKVWAEIWGS